MPLTKRLASPKIPLLLFLALSVGVGYLLLTHTVRRAGDTDTLGYVYAARRLADGAGLTYFDANNLRVGPYFSLNAFRIVRDSQTGIKHLGFPPGLPILLAPTELLTGREGAIFFGVPLFAIVSLFAMGGFAYALSRKRWRSLLTVALLATTPSFWRYGTETWSEIPSLVLLTSGLALYWWSRHNMPGENTTGRAVLGGVAGVLLGYSVWIRYTNVFVLAGVGLFELFAAQQDVLRQRWRWSLYIPIIGSLIGILFFNAGYYGGMLQTSYSPENGWYVQAPFALSYAFGKSFVGGFSVIEGAKTLWANFSVGLLLIPIGLWQLARKQRRFLLITALPVLAIYAIYAFPAKGINSRFLLITFPMIAIAIVWGGVWLGQQVVPTRWRPVAAIVLIGLLFLRVPPQLAASDLRAAQLNEDFDEVRAWVDGTEPDAVFVSYIYNDRLFAFGERSVFNYRHMLPYDSAENRYNYDQFPPCFVNAINTMLEQQIPVYFVEDQTPTLYESYALLQANFELVQFRPNPNIVKVIAPKAPQPALAPCRY